MFIEDASEDSVLIVDDNPRNLQILADILRNRNYKVAIAKRGFYALTFICKKKPDLILLDIMMPEIDGFEICRQLKNNKDTNDIPIIFISSLTDTESKLKGFELGGVDYITKPFQEKEVIARVSSHLRIRRLQKKLQERNLLLQQEISEKKHKEEELHQAKEVIEAANRDLEERVQDELKKRQKQQQLLIQKSKLESLGKLAAGIAHEINQPLSGISMGLDNISFKLSADKITPNYLKQKLDSFRKDIERINYIINHIRAFSRDQASILFEDIDVNEVSENAVSFLHTQYKNHNINITLELDRSPGFVMGNKYKLEQVLLNLISNAKDALEEKYKLFNASCQKHIVIRTYADRNQVCMEVRDNGIGIPDEYKDNIFDPFFTTKDPEKGTGLGLSVSYGIIKEMKGDISVESQSGEYTYMKISLPKVMEK